VKKFEKKRPRGLAFMWMVIIIDSSAFFCYGPIFLAADLRWFYNQGRKEVALKCWLWVEAIKIYFE